MDKEKQILNELLHDKNDDVRLAIAKKGYGLDVLENDTDKRIRREVAKTHATEKLARDPEKQVRKLIAEQGKFLEILVNDENWEIRNSLLKEQE